MCVYVPVFLLKYQILVIARYRAVNSWGGGQGMQSFVVILKKHNLLSRGQTVF